VEIFELLGALVEGFVGLLDALSSLSLLVDFLAVIADVVSLFKSRNNRLLRTEARRSGQRPPPRNLWTWVALVLTPIIVIVAVWVAVKRLGR